jgi:hypothetical protein
MNILNFKPIYENHGICIDLYIDDKSIYEIFDKNIYSLPYWIFDDDLPYYPPGEKENNSRRIIGVCSCGEYGCGNINCEIKETRENIEIFDFQGDVRKEHRSLRFIFDKLKFNETIKEILNIIENNSN